VLLQLPASRLRNVLAILTVRNAAHSGQMPQNIGVICPYGASAECYRTGRRGSRDFNHRLLGMFPWRCEVCRNRFYLRTRSLG
jgi:hypothetical protein